MQIGRKRTVICKPGKHASNETNPAVTLILDFGLQNCEKINLQLKPKKKKERERRKERKKRKSNYKPLKGGQLLPSLVYQKHLSSTNLVCFSQKENDLLIVRLRNTDLPLLLGKFTELGLLSCSETWTNLLFHFHLSYGQ